MKKAMKKAKSKVKAVKMFGLKNKWTGDLVGAWITKIGAKRIYMCLAGREFYQIVPVLVTPAHKGKP